MLTAKIQGKTIPFGDLRRAAAEQTRRSTPIFPALHDDEVDRVIEALRSGGSELVYIPAMSFTNGIGLKDLQNGAVS